jgi:hypothetical protein
VVWQWTSICKSKNADVNACSQSSKLHRSGIPYQPRLYVTGIVIDFSQVAQHRLFRADLSHWQQKHSGGIPKGGADEHLCQLWHGLAVHSSRSAETSMLPFTVHNPLITSLDTKLHHLVARMHQYFNARGHRRGNAINFDRLGDRAYEDGWCDIFQQQAASRLQVLT